MGSVHMFGDGVQEKLALVRDSVNTNLPRVVRSRQQEGQKLAPKEIDSKRNDVSADTPIQPWGYCDASIVT